MTNIRCTGACGREVAAKDMERSGWSYLQITGKWRCGPCGRELMQVSTQGGGHEQDADQPLPPDSIGALKKLPERPPLRESVKP